MITIICGEDTISSRNYFISLKKNYFTKGFEIKNLKFDQIGDITRWLADSPSLFFQKKVFFAERLNKHVKKENKKIVDDLQRIAAMKDVELVDWEEVSGWELKLKKIGQIKEFKPNQTIFKLLDLLYPGNKVLFLSLLNKLSQELDENFIFIMLIRYVRNLIVIKEGAIPPRMQSWQTFKLKSQANHWKIENLVNFYEALFKIEVGLKSGSNPFSVKESLDILACHFL
ncbi:hypothetical protein A3A46_04680 [Candidatus Roizmanbacteria bacterium RIFCSPLOWO2_01_FULL_37_13]|uniref:DNA polymerase III delta N-terminal domain-containing protein n=1 Tax=Candidatus Roizmanbacteria bacterium RIFCSPHIGHO2_02_FULL_38_11 TaxID=1802039 RepID=A0A1F7GWY1_9BACT|nr:MAG: hypothetical protein A3C25_04830 [Candidatus Roizmanbacteria bacterium RIFCSPHIGHO2_02_FULL_38_11]OGK34536.1 MAG: hypothetical protein A3F58_02220 [Candidatus Roizmanbacteria bacterium RIFCSPHIGHO2_12_FULL_37_9b]OGK41199.1 MAG: hypothetical protein A3A46_04680 [Candidatus Roizmanbacteria bacterium RIFCSPLOWO2_01_FULL_37_13]